MAQLEVTRQGSVKPFTIVDGPYAWTAADYKDNKSYITVLNEEDLAELEAAVAAALQKRSDIKDIKLGDFELPTLAERLIAIREEVRAGRGFAIIKGVPVDRWSRQVVTAAYWIMGLHWGNAKSNNKQGHLIGHIKDIGHDPNNPNTRLYATNAAQPWHNDSADIVTLLCLRNAKEGGHSGWSSSISVHNEILRRAPELAQLLAGPWWYYDRKGEVPAGKLPYFLIPVFNYHQGYLSVNFSSNYYYLSQRHPEVPRLGPDHLAAIKLFEELAAGPELAMHAVLEPGDIQVLNNHTCLHHRTAFVDHEDPAERRHLLRLWLAPENDRPLPEVYSEIYGGSVEPGQRGGIRIEGHQEHITLEAE